MSGVQQAINQVVTAVCQLRTVQKLLSAQMIINLSNRKKCSAQTKKDVFFNAILVFQKMEMKLNMQI
jgi:hypothetical protein